jgi:transcriptional regulator with XRE-family HTH domain
MANETNDERGVGGATEFGALLSQFRTARGWSQIKLAERAGIDGSYVSRLEAGGRAPTREAIDRLTDALVLPVVDRERLLAAAGFRSEAWDDPLLSQLVELLADPTVPPDVAADLRTLIRVAIQHGRRGRNGIRPDREDIVLQVADR